MQNAPLVGSTARPRSTSWLRNTAIAAVLLAAIAGGVWYQWFRPNTPSTTVDAAVTQANPGGAPAKTGVPSGGAGGGRFGADPNRVQPVAAVPAKLGDINIVQTGLGTVAALKVATVKARVDGLLQSATF